MKKITLCCLALLALLGLNTTAMAREILNPECYAMIGETRYLLPYERTDTGWLLPAVSFENAEGKIQFGGGQVNIDWSITYGLAVVDFGAPTVFGFVFAVPIGLPALPTVVNASIVGGLTDATGNGVSLTPMNPPNPLQGGLSYTQDNSLAAIAFTWSVGLGAAFGPGPPGSLYNYGAFVFGPAAGPPGPFAGLFTTTTTFSLSGGGDIAALTGFCSIDPIPLPASLILLGSGLLGLAGWRLRKK